MSAIAAANDPTTALWESLRDFIVQAFSLFGAPHQIAQHGVRLRTEHAPLLHYLRQCEALLRKLLFLEALALAPSLSGAPPVSGRKKSIRKRRFHEQDPENSETWRVTFRATHSSPAGRGNRRTASDEGGGAKVSTFSVTPSADTGERRFTSTWPAAERFEALLRAFNDPAPYVSRLARLIKRKAQLTRVFAHAPVRRYGQTILEEEIRDACLLIRQRRREPDSS